MGRVIFDDNRIIPAPFVDISVNYERSGEGEITGVNYGLTLNGTILPEKGSPNSSGVFHTTTGYPADENIDADGKLGAILRKQTALMGLFSAANDGKTLEIQSDDASEPLKAYPKIVDTNFPSDLWYQTSQYTISMVADQIFPLTENIFDFNIRDASESWSIDPDEQREDEYTLTYRLTHSISAQGKRIYNAIGEISQEPWKNAKDWVLSKSGFDNNIILSSGVNNISSGVYNGYDYLKSEVIDEIAGQYSLTETWVLSSGTALEDFDMSLTKGINSSVKGVSIQGRINGLEERDSNYDVSVTKIDNAISKFNNVSGLFYSRCQNHLNQFSSGLLNSIPTQENISQNKYGGTLSYSFEYDTRPENLLSGVLSESISVSYIDQNDSFASVPIIGRSFGPILQETNTSDARQKSLNIEFVKEPSLDRNNIGESFKFPDSLVSTIVNELDPSNADSAVKSFKSQPNKSYDPYTGVGSYSINWTYEV